MSALMAALFMGTIVRRQGDTIGYDIRLDVMDLTGNVYVTGLFDGDIPNGAWVRCTHGPMFRTLWDDLPIIVEWWVDPPRRQGFFGKVSRLAKRISGMVVRFEGWL